MKVNVYADILFLINFSMDFLALRLCAHLLHLRSKLWRLCVASALGGVYAVASVFVPGNPWVELGISLFAAFLICYISFGKEASGVRLLKTWVAFFVSSLLLGGMISALYNVLADIIGKTQLGTATSGGVGVFLLLAVICGALTSFLCRTFTTMTKVHNVGVRVRFAGKSTEFSALIDSGNLLTDPLTGKKVIVVGLRSVMQILPFDVVRQLRQSDVTHFAGMSMESMRRVTVVPVSGIGGSRLLLGFRPDEITIIEMKRNKKSEYIIDAIIAIDGGEVSDFGGYDALVPSALIA